MRNVLIRIVTSLTVAAVTMGVAQAPAHAGFADGNRLYQDCSSEKGDVRLWLCAGFITGAVHGNEPLGGCVPHTVKLDQVRDVVHQYLQKHPEKRHIEANALPYCRSRSLLQVAGSR